jgi:hypothetical protein
MLKCQVFLGEMIDGPRFLLHVPRGPYYAKFLLAKALNSVSMLLLRAGAPPPMTSATYIAADWTLESLVSSAVGASAAATADAVVVVVNEAQSSAAASAMASVTCRRLRSWVLLAPFTEGDAETPRNLAGSACSQAAPRARTYA